ncbi:hypothetical protein R2R35_13795 [Anaerocolumna sp. AGMB13020]|uniref:hypothetical protein n=1 Tax=Anaerocolumna sp. AGMB13020 TaxID=3081750 RepID=UPI0029537F6C|nr:hypothetical protein [Anaerocolumna sp. AGMB13020]WOO34873.1 hypothetical protein R2R35_13795 [Anaerocolumna sp. AGMB13020]
MKSKSRTWSVFKDIYESYFKYTIWFIIAIIIMHFGMSVLSFRGAAAAAALRDGVERYNLYITSYSASGAFMLIIGIVTGFIQMPFYVTHGVTRKDYFRGNVLATLALAFTLALVFSVGSEVGKVIFLQFGYSFKEEILIPGLSNNWLLLFFLYGINIFAYSLMGWLINIGFYRYHAFIGIGFIVVALAALALHGLVWINGWFSIFSDDFKGILADNSLYLSVIGTIGLIAVLLGLIRMLTRKVPIKI